MPIWVTALPVSVRIESMRSNHALVACDAWETSPSCQAMLRSHCIKRISNSYRMIAAAQNRLFITHFEHNKFFWRLQHFSGRARATLQPNIIIDSFGRRAGADTHARSAPITWQARRKKGRSNRRFMVHTFLTHVLDHKFVCTRALSSMTRKTTPPTRRVCVVLLMPPDAAALAWYDWLAKWWRRNPSTSNQYRTK